MNTTQIGTNKYDKQKESTLRKQRHTNKQVHLDIHKGNIWTQHGSYKSWNKHICTFPQPKYFTSGSHMYETKYNLESVLPAFSNDCVSPSGFLVKMLPECVYVCNVSVQGEITFSMSLLNKWFCLHIGTLHMCTHSKIMFKNMNDQPSAPFTKHAEHACGIDPNLVKGNVVIEIMYMLELCVCMCVCSRVRPHLAMIIKWYSNDKAMINHL